MSEDDKLLQNLQKLYVKNMFNLKPKNKMSKTELLLLIEILKSLKAKIEKLQVKIQLKLNKLNSQITDLDSANH